MAMTLLLRLKAKQSGHARSFIYWTDDGSVAALRYENWKISFLRQNALGLDVWTRPFVVLRAPSLVNLRMDPFERAEREHAMGFQRWYLERMYVICPCGRLMLQNGCRASRNSRLAKNLEVSVLTGSWNQ